MTVLEIIKKYLEETGADGLVSDGHCSCKSDDLEPCGQMNSDCRSAKLADCNHCPNGENKNNCGNDYCMI